MAPIIRQFLAKLLTKQSAKSFADQLSRSPRIKLISCAIFTGRKWRPTARQSPTLQTLASGPLFIPRPPGGSQFTMMTNSAKNGADYPAICKIGRKFPADQLPEELRSYRFASAFAFAADELFDAAISFVVGHLYGRMLGKIGGGGMQHAADAAIERQLAAADRIDCHAS